MPKRFLHFRGIVLGLLLATAIAGCGSSPETVVNRWIEAGPDARSNPCPAEMHPAYVLGMKLTHQSYHADVIERDGNEVVVRYSLSGKLENQQLDATIGKVEISVGDINVSELTRNGQVRLRRKSGRWRIVCEGP